ncbi:MAG TPA: RNA-guided endonuclease IscB, partial [Fervidobacterium sp.]|nr:RNA-guided endonuclease IscB [Fervidobacterium sp.]
NDISELLKERRMYRRIRRSRLRYRKRRFDNRISTKKEGWLAPSIKHKLDSHVRFVDYLKKILPITNIVVEVANFDTHKLKNPDVTGEGYQQGEQQDFWNVREYVLYRDNYTCQLCGKKNTILEVHHIGYWKQDRTDRPGNLITLCAKCHNSNNHKDGGKLYGMKPVQKPLKDATFMSTIRWKLVNTLMCGYTYGYITKSKRVSLGLEKTHYNDAFCIAGGINQQRIEPIYFEQNRRNNRSLEKFYDAKYVDIRDKTIKTGQELFCGRRTRNKNLNEENLHKCRGAKVSKGRRNIRKQRHAYQPKDIVIFEGKQYSVQGVQNKGEYIKLTEKSKPVKTNIVKPYMFSKGFSVVYNCNSSPTYRSGSLLAGK